MTIEEGFGLPSIIEQERATLKTTRQNHVREIEIFAGMLNTFTSGFNRMGSFVLKDDNESEFIWLLLSTRCLHSLRCSIDLMLKGYYSQAMSIIRTITEDWFICGNAQGNDDVRNCLLNDKGRMPRYIDLAEQMKAINIYEGDYRYQSKFTHSSKLSLRVLTNPKTNEMRIASVYDEMLFLLCAESLIRVFLLMAEYLGRVLFYIDKDKAKSWDAQNGQNVKDASKWLEEIRVKYSNADNNSDVRIVTKNE